jgi:formylglycine-generating enzyme required for sulfatase activity
VKRRLHFLWFGVLVLPSLAWVGAEVWTKLHQAKLCAQEYDPPQLGMVFVPAGEFWMGSDDPNAEPDERPLRKVFLPAFYIDQFEVTNRRYREFKTDLCYPAGEDDLPVTFVFKREAEEFCRWAGRRLPTNTEWEKAARGTDGRIYPWGNKFSADRANINRRTSFAATNAQACKSPFVGSKGKLSGGSFPKGASPYGCQDMAGNVWEWVSDVWVDKHSIGLSYNGDERGIIRGGAYSYSPLQARTSYQAFEALGATCHDVGFRCAMDAVVKTK